MMVDLYEQCKYKMQIINRKKKNDGGTYTRHARHADKNDSIINNKK